MKKLFPEMYDRAETGQVIVSALYWLACYCLIPFVMTVVLVGSYGDSAVVTGFDIGIYALNFLAMLGIFGRYLKDSFLNVQINLREFLATVLACAVLMSLITL